MRYLSGMKEAARRQAERQALPTGQQWHLVGFCTSISHTTENKQPLVAELNRFPGGQNTDDRPNSTSSQCLLMPLQQHSTAVVRGALKAFVDVLH